jgi:hypothetical protein
VQRGPRTSLLVLAGVALLAGCGGSSKVDRGGFTAGDRKAAEEVLGILAQTSVWDTAAQVTFTNGSPPAACTLHIVQTKPLTFRLFVSWIPQAGLNRRYAWLQAVVGPEGLKQDYSFRLRYARTEKALKAHYGDAFTKPFERCLVLANGRFALLPSE